MLELLERRHDRQGFDSGVPALDQFLAQTARQSIAKGSSRTFVWTLPGSERPNQVLGFFTLTTDVVVTTELAPPLVRRYSAGRIPEQVAGLHAHRALGQPAALSRPVSAAG